MNRFVAVFFLATAASALPEGIYNGVAFNELNPALGLKASDELPVAIVSDL